MEELRWLSWSVRLTLHTAKNFENTIRYHMARSAEVAYTYLTVPDAIKLFDLGNEQGLQAFVEKQAHPGNQSGGAGAYNWKLSAGKLFFTQQRVAKITLNSLTNMQNLFQYANELEKIV